MQLTRREALAAMSAAGSATGQIAAIDPDLVRRNDEAVDALLKLQITDPANRWRGIFPDASGLYWPGSAAGVIDRCTASFLSPGSRYSKSPLMLERIRLAAELLEREQSPEGNIFNPITNFNSPPDTAFVVQGVGSAACNAKKLGASEIVTKLAPFLRKAGQGMALGGVHTPNHRWVVCSALAQIDELFPHPAHLRRIGQWLAEGMDIDADGQYTERSTYQYDPIVDRALIIVADKLRRPALLDPVRKNLDANLYLLHPGYELVTEISRRQDLNQRGTMAPYWFSLAYMAALDQNGQYATLVREFAPQSSWLSAVQEYPRLAEPLPKAVPVPDDYEKRFASIGVTRIRRGLTSATLLDGNSRFLTLRRGDAVIQAVRFASAFFGKGQFMPEPAQKRDGSYHLSQSLDAGYYQPLDPPHPVLAGDWGSTWPSRRRTEVCRMEQSAVVTERQNGFALRIRANGTRDVAVAVELSFLDGGKLEGCTPAKNPESGLLLESGYGVYRMGKHAIRFGPGVSAHQYTQVRGALPRIPGTTVYITGFTPFDHSLEFQWV